MSCRVGSSVVSQGVVTAIGLGADGRKHFWAATWSTPRARTPAAFLGGLRERGLAGVRLVVSDSHAGLVAAVSRLFQGCAWQRCVTHPQRNLQSACSGRPRGPKAAVRGPRARRGLPDDPDLARCVWAEAAPGWRRCPPGPARSSSRPRTPRWRSRPSQGALGQAPHQQRPGARQPREIKRRYRVVQSFPSRESMLRLTCASPHGDRGAVVPAARVSRGLGRRGLRRARGQAGPDRGEAGALGGAPVEIVDEIVEKRGLKKE
ncbi:MAG: transposase [Collinsella aerofaciens]